MNTYNFTWVEMSSGFNKECNIVASTEENAIKIFMNMVWWDKQLTTLDPIKEFAMLSIHIYNLTKVYSQEFITKFDPTIHFTENEQYTFLF